MLNTNNFDDIVLEYRREYNESLIVPYFIITVLIAEDAKNEVPLNRIIVLKDDDEHIRSVDSSLKYTLCDGKYAYRCDLCGDVLDERGNILWDK